MRVRPTIRGLALLAALVVVFAVGPDVVDPSAAGTVAAALLAVLVVGAVWPPLALLGARLEVADAPTDLLVGDLAPARLLVSRAPASMGIAAVGTGGEPAWVGGSGTVTLPMMVGRRGVLVAVRLELSTDAPFGIVRARRRLEVPLPRALWVGPSPIHVPADPGAVPDHGHGEQTHGVPGSGDTVRSVRPYTPGDPAHRVHWPTSARAGELMVLELEPPAPRGLAVVVDLTGDPRAAEGAAARASGLVRSVLAEGGRAVLCSRGLEGSSVLEVRSLRQLDRALAAAMPGVPPAPPPGWDAVRVAAVVPALGSPRGHDPAVPHDAEFDGPALDDAWTDGGWVPAWAESPTGAAPLPVPPGPEPAGGGSGEGRP